MFALAIGSLHLFDATIKGGGESVPEMEEGIFFKADINEHRLEGVFDISDSSFKNTSDDVAIRLAFDRVLLENAIFEEGDSSLELFAIDDEFVAGLARSQSDEAFDAFGHGNEFGVKFTKHVV